MPAKRVILDGVVWQAVELLAKETGKDFQDLSNEAFRDLLKKHRRPVGLQDALWQSLKRGKARERP